MTTLTQNKVSVMGWHPSFESSVRSMCEEFSKESLDEYGIGITEDKMMNMIDALKECSLFLLINNEPEGMIAGTMVDSLTNGKRVLQEVVWFVSKEHRSHGKLLLNEFEKLGIEKKAECIVMGLMGNSMFERLDVFYRRQGYKKLEVQYIKELKCPKN